MKRHLLIHIKEKPFKCWFQGCDYRSNQKSNLGHHFRLIHQPKISNVIAPNASSTLTLRRKKIFLINKVDKEVNQLFEGTHFIFDFRIYSQMINERINHLFQ